MKSLEVTLELMPNKQLYCYIAESYGTVHYSLSRAGWLDLGECYLGIV